MTKRHFLIIALLTFVGIQVFAEQVDERQAVQIAVEFMNQKADQTPSFHRGKKMKANEMIISHVIRSLTGAPNLYILNARKTGGGFVIVSGETLTSDAVLGYSDTGCFDYENGPENARGWVDGYSQAIDSIRLQGPTRQRTTRKADNSKVIEPLLSTQWSQDAPYNDLCPHYCLTGCVATAMAQIMKYWNWPEQGRGSHTNKSYASQTVDFSQSHYDWDMMLDSYSGSETEESKKAVAKLMYDCGCSLDMMYSNYSSGTNSSIPNALFWYFKYKESTDISRNGYSGDWEELLLNELRERRPVLCSGSGESGNHAFVCDGYEGDGFFHINFGWGGFSDGNYKMDEDFEYSQNQTALVGLCPDYEMSTLALDGMIYKIMDDSNVCLCSCYDTDTGSVIIPESVEIDGKEYAVTEIGASAFALYPPHIYNASRDLTSLTIPNSVITIGDSAFFNSYNLTSLTILNSVTTIGDYAFSKCSALTNLTIPNSVTTIGDDAFYGCPIENLVWDSNFPLHFITNFCAASLTEVILGPNVTSLGDYALYGCSGLTSVTIPNSVTTIGEYAFGKCSSLTSVTIPNSVTSIENFAFRNCSGLTNVVIGSSVATIGEDVFYDCPLREVYVSWDTPIETSYWTFLDYSGTLYVPMGTKALYSATFPWSQFHEIKEYDAEGGFYHDPEKTAILNDLLYQKIDESHARLCECLEKNNMEFVTIPESVEINGKEYVVTEIGASAFRGCSGLSNVTIPNSITTIGNHAFYDCSGLTSVTIPNSTTTIEDHTFARCSGMTSVVIPNSVTTIGNHAFKDCTGLVNMTIPNSVATIGESAFYGCSNLTCVTIPNSVTTIGDGAFYYCNIEKLIWDSNFPIRAIIRSCSNSLKEVVFGSDITSIEESAFSGCTGLMNMTIPNSVTTIGAYAFSGCTGLTCLTIPNSVTTIGESAFYGCTGLTNMTIPDSVITIGAYAFSNCIGLTNMVIGNSVTTIGDFAFLSCWGLTSVVIGNSVTTFGSNAFAACLSLSEVYVSWNTPIETSSWTFSDYNYSATLYVPMGTKALYAATFPWSQFHEIKEYDVTGVHAPEAIREPIEIGRYGLDGTISDGNRKGIHVIRMSDGSTKKVLVK